MVSRRLASSSYYSPGLGRHTAPEMGVKESEETQAETTVPVVKPKKKRAKPYKDDPNIELVPLTDFGFFLQVGDMYRQKNNFDEDGKEKKSRERITLNLLLEFEGKPEAEIQAIKHHQIKQLINLGRNRLWNVGEDQPSSKSCLLYAIARMAKAAKTYEAQKRKEAEDKEAAELSAEGICRTREWLGGGKRKPASSEQKMGSASESSESELESGVEEDKRSQVSSGNEKKSEESSKKKRDPVINEIVDIRSYRRRISTFSEWELRDERRSIENILMAPIRELYFAKCWWTIICFCGRV